MVVGGGPLSKGVLVRAVSARETPRMVTCGWYASYWNAFLLSLYIAVVDQSKMSRIPAARNKKQV